MVEAGDVMNATTGVVVHRAQSRMECAMAQMCLCIVIVLVNGPTRFLCPSSGGDYVVFGSFVLSVARRQEEGRTSQEERSWR